MWSDWLVFVLFLNQMSHTMMFPMRHMMTKRTRNQTKFWYICVLYGHVLVPFRLCSLLIFGNLFLFNHKSVHCSFFLSFFCFFLWSPISLVLSPSFFLTLNIFFYFLIPPHCIFKTQDVFQSFLSLVYHAKMSRSLLMPISDRMKLKSQFTICFFKTFFVEDTFKQITW